MAKIYWWQGNSPDSLDNDNDELKRMKEENDSLKRQLEKERTNNKRNFAEKTLGEISTIDKDKLFLRQDCQNILEIVEGKKKIPLE